MRFHRASSQLCAAVCAALLALVVSSRVSVAQGSQPQAPNAASQPQSAPPKIPWQKGPFRAKLGDVAEIDVPAGYEFADGDGARKYLELTGNPSEGTEIGIVTPTAEGKGNDWVVLFDFDETGYVKDNEKSSIDANALLNDIRSGAEKENEERRRRGWIPFHITGWQTTPFYDDATHNLTWATVGHSDVVKDGETINYSTRILGRRGVMRVDLVTDPETVSATLPPFRSIMGGFAFTAGSRYADFVRGDKVAEFGLTALIAGGATAVALKTGLFAKLLAMLAGLWKIIAVGFAAMMTRIKNIWRSITNKFRREPSGAERDSF
jgi:uncharacterized membrane-anchored protein